MPESIWEAVLSWGPGALGFILLYFLVRTGDLRTRFEVEAYKEQVTRISEQAKEVNETFKEAMNQNKEYINIIEDMTRRMREHIDTLEDLISSVRDGGNRGFKR